MWLIKITMNNKIIIFALLMTLINCSINEIPIPTEILNIFESEKHLVGYTFISKNTIHMILV